MPRFRVQGEVTFHLHSKTSKVSGVIFPLPELKLKVKNGKECFAHAQPTLPPGAVLRIFGGGASASAEKILEFEGAKSSFQKGLGSKSRFLKISKVLSLQGLKSSLDIKFRFMNPQT